MKGSGSAVACGIPSPSKRRNKNSASLAGASRSVTRKTRCPYPSLLTRAVILKTASNICCSSLCACDCMNCSHPFVPGLLPGSERAGQKTRNERVVWCVFLEHRELWDEHLVDDVHDAVVRDYVRLKHLPTIDRDAFPHRGGYRV